MNTLDKSGLSKDVVNLIDELITDALKTVEYTKEYQREDYAEFAQLVETLLLILI